VAIRGQQALQERAPWQRDGELVDTTDQRTGQILCGCHQEQRVWQSLLPWLSRSAARRIGQLRSVRIDTDHELVCMTAGTTQDGLARARSKVDHDARGAVGPFG
jgi:hypothetical protein